MDPEGFEILGSIHSIEVIAAGRSVRAAKRLRELYGGQRWRKMKGIATVREPTGELYEAEIHWFEAHGVGRCDWKIKKRIT